MAKKSSSKSSSSKKKKANPLSVKVPTPHVLKNVQKAGDAIGSKAMEIKDSAINLKEGIEDKVNELDRMLEESIAEYNDAYTLMNDRGIQLLTERNRSIDTIYFIENLVNSIANKPKSFEADFDVIHTSRDSFLNTCDFGLRELNAARESAGNAAAGLAAAASVTFMAPTAAMWVATTFGTASTGTAISTLSGAAATNAALAWLGGGALAAGGGGMAAGNALLAMAGPIGWTIAGASLMTSIVLFTRKKTKINKQRNEEIASVKKNTQNVKKTDKKIETLLNNTINIRNNLNQSYCRCLNLYGQEYNSFDSKQKKSLAALVNNTRSLAELLDKTVK